MRLFLAFLLLTFSSFAGASGPPSADADKGTGPDPVPGKVLTLDQALALAAHNSPALQEADASVGRAKAGVSTARAYTNPGFDFLGGHQVARPILTPGVPGSVFHYSASQRIEIPRERSTRMQVAKLDLAGNTHRAEGVRLSVTAEVKRVFYDVVERKEQLANARENLDLVEDLRRRVRLEVEVGEKGKLELTRAEAEYSRAAAAVRSADVQLANARAIFKAVVGAMSEELYDADGSLNTAVSLQPLNELRQRILANHPALSEAHSLQERARATVQHERALRIPAPLLVGEYEQQPDITYYRFGVSVPIPLWDRRKGQIGEAQAEARRADALTRQRELELTSALERAYDQYQISNEQITGLQAGSLREAQAAVDAARSAYKFGERGIVEVLDAQRVLQGVRSDLLDAMYARQSALIDLEELGVTQP